MNQSALGVCYMLLATFLFALMSTFVKLLDGIPVLETIFFRSLISLILCLLPLMRARVDLWGNNRPLLMLRGLAGALALSMNFYLIQEIPLATASTLTYLAPICTALIGVYFVKEPVRLMQIVFFVISFAGVVMIQGFDARISAFHLFVGLATSIAMGVAYNCVRKLSRNEHPLVIIFYFPLMTLPIAGLWTAYNWVTPRGLEWVYILGVGVTTQVAQYYMTRAYQLAEIATVSIVNFTGIIYAIGIGFILFGESFNLLTYLGMLLVLAGVALNVLFKHRSRKTPGC